MHIPFRKLRYNTPWVPFRFTTSYISVAFSPLAANNFARLAYHRLRSGAILTQTFAHALTLTQSDEVHVTFRPFTVCPSLPAVALLSAPSRWCSQPPPLRLALDTKPDASQSFSSASLTARYAAKLQPLLLPAAANASFCRRRFYLSCQHTRNIYQLKYGLNQFSTSSTIVSIVTFSIGKPSICVIIFTWSPCSMSAII